MKTILFTTILLVSITVTAQERLEIYWPEKYGLQPTLPEEISIEDETGTHIIATHGFSEGGKPAEDSGFYTQIITVKDYVIPDVMRLVEDTRKMVNSYGYSGEVKVIESGITGTHRWVLYTFSLNERATPVSALNYSIAGNHNTYTAQVFITAESFENEQLKEWSQVLKSSQLINE